MLIRSHEFMPTTIRLEFIQVVCLGMIQSRSKCALYIFLIKEVFHARFMHDL